MSLVKKIARDESGSALITVLIIAVIVSLFIGAVLSGIVLQSRFIQQDINRTKALYAAESGIYTFLSQYQPNSITSDTTLQMDGAELSVSQFGGFWDISSSVDIQNQHRGIRVLVGEKSSSIFEHAVAIGDTTSGVLLSGSTTIKGDILIGKRQSIREDNFKGFPFSGSFSGDTKYYEGDTLFPVYDISAFEFQEEKNEKLFKGNSGRSFPANFNQVDLELIKEKDTLYFNDGLVLESMVQISLPNDLVMIVKGNALIDGEISFGAFTKILVQDTLQLKGAISGSSMLLYSGLRTEIDGEVQFSAQVHTQGEVVLSGNAYLEYPSLIYSSKDVYNGRDEQVIHLKDNTVLDGTIVYPFQTQTFNRTLFMVKVDEQATVRGGIYTGGTTELDGKVLGSVLTRQFFFYSSPTDYFNRLHDLSIDVTQRPENYVLPLGFSDTTKYAILNWFEVTE